MDWYQRAQSLVGSATLDQDFLEDIRKVHEHEPTRKSVNNVPIWPLLPFLHTGSHLELLPWLS